MKEKSMQEIIDKIKELNFNEDFDLIIGIKNGGVVPSYLLGEKLNSPIDFVKIHFRDENQNPKYKEPVLTEECKYDISDKKILLVDDVSKTGKTIEKAKNSLNAYKIKTFVVNGKADYNLYDEECFWLPWRVK